MNGLLEMDPSKRFTAYEALMHPFFDDIRDPEFEQQMDKVTQYSRAFSPDS
jgi:serine/threonine protein kinase